jgi:methionyl-tRNA formyltransferase
MNNMNIGVLASGNLGNICLAQLHHAYPIAFVLTDKSSVSILDFCANNNIPVFAGNPRGGKATSFVKQYPADVILSINYLFIVEEDVYKHPTLYSINFHGSLLPKYRGRTPHVWAIINNESVTGITAHLITAGCDEGAILYQEKIEIPPDATGANLLQTFNKKYPDIVSHVMQQLTTSALTPQMQDEAQATYFGKRTPEDGGINWDWHKERIYNWVRAQAHPYPGAFSYVNNNKIVIHKISFSNLGFHQDQDNGLVLSGGSNPIIKTSNGAVQLSHFVIANNYILNKGDRLT